MPAESDFAPRDMKPERFEVMAALERTHWWFRAKRLLLRDELTRRGPMNHPVIDVGCGTGAMIAALGAGNGVGLDVSAHALGLAAASHPEVRFVAASGLHLPFADRSIGTVIAADVIEHLDDDVAALKEFARVTRSTGDVAIVVPAYRWAWSQHDVELGHRRRYGRRQLVSVMEQAGIEVRRSSYFHSWLVPVAFLLRKTPLRRLVRGTAEEVSYVNAHVNRGLSLVCRLERLVIRWASVPFGLSLIAVGTPRRPESATGR